MINDNTSHYITKNSVGRGSLQNGVNPYNNVQKNGQKTISQDTNDNNKLYLSTDLNINNNLNELGIFDLGVSTSGYVNYQQPVLNIMPTPKAIQPFSKKITVHEPLRSGQISQRSYGNNNHDSQ
jgi:hypothetical protein